MTLRTEQAGIFSDTQSAALEYMKTPAEVRGVDE